MHNKNTLFTPEFNYLISSMGMLAVLHYKHNKIRHEATHDSLTGMLNGRGLDQKLAKIKRPSAVLFVDGTHQKAVNDRYGHHRGDQTIKATAEVITDSLREGDVAARIGGDEFLILLSNEGEGPRRQARPPEEVLGGVMTRMKQRTQDYLAASPDLVEVGFDIAVGGIVCEPDMTVDDLHLAVKAAEDEMYQAKAEQHRLNPAHRS